MFTLENFTRLRYKIFVVCLMVLSLSLLLFHSLTEKLRFSNARDGNLKKIKVCHELLFKKKNFIAVHRVFFEII